MPPKGRKQAKKKKKPPPNIPAIPADAYKVHRRSFNGRPRMVVCHNNVGHSPLVALSNLLLLRHGEHHLLETFEMTDKTIYASHKKLQEFVCFHLRCVLNARQKEGTISEDQRDQSMEEYKAAVNELHLRRSGGAYPMFSSVKTFACMHNTTASIVLLFPPLSVSMYHALIPDPKDTDLCSATSGKSFAELVRDLKQYDEENNDEDDRLSVVRKFLNGPDLTPHGLDLLCEEAPEDHLFLFYLNVEFHVVYKKGKQLYLLAAEEEMFNKHRDIMWIRLDEEFNTENLLESKTKLTSTFSPVNEEWISIQKELIEEAEAENRRLEMAKERKHDKAETTLVPEEHSTCVETQVETLLDSHDSPKAAEMMQSKIEVDTRFLRFMHRRVLSFNQFTSAYIMHKIYHYKERQYNSTSYIGRLMAKGYLVRILNQHQSGYSWNGHFTEDDMFVELELIHGVEGLEIGEINFFITLSANDDFRKTCGISDLETFVRILFPHYLPEGFQQLPCYFQMFEDDIKEMPESRYPPEKFEKYQKYMADHFFAKAPLARSTIISGVRALCDTEVPHVDKNKPKPRYPLLDAAPVESLQYISLLSEEVNDVFFPESRLRRRIVASNRFTYWDSVQLGRHCTNHMMEKTMDKNGVQQMQDPILIDLILENDLKGLLTHAIRLMIEGTNFKGRFESTWQHFSRSESKDDGTPIPLPHGDEHVEVSEKPPVDLAEKPPVDLAEKPPAATQCLINDHGMKLTREGLKSLAEKEWIRDEVIEFVYCQLGKELFSVEDFVVVLPAIAHTLVNLGPDDRPSDVLDPGDANLFLFPVNNSKDHELKLSGSQRKVSGSHWSLLVVCIDRMLKECRFVHYDSIRNMNKDAVSRLFRNLERWFPNFSSRIEEGQIPQQSNGYDCGMYVISISEQIVKWYKSEKKEQKAAIDWIDAVAKVDQEMVSNRRRELFEDFKKKFDILDSEDSAAE